MNSFNIGDIVTCISIIPGYDLTIGKKYMIEGINKSLVLIINDRGIPQYFLFVRFSKEEIKIIHEKKHLKLIKGGK